MQIIPTATRTRPSLVVVLLLLAAACQAPQPPPDNRYQRPLDSGASVTPTSSEPLRQLHNQALAAINEDQYALATDYLQRAIRIEPRNGWSWHYLADIHWRQGDYERCASMLERAEAYAADDARLASANSELRRQCQ